MIKLKKVLCIFFIVMVLFGCSAEKKELIFADAGWDSAKFHNAVAGFVAETAFGYEKWTEIMGSSTVLHEGLVKGELDVHMEVWTDNLTAYAGDLKAGKLKELGVNFDDNNQGFYVPRYVIEGDSARSIKPMAPGLKTVADLKNYKDVFPDDEHKGKGRIYGSIPGWDIDTVMFKKYEYYGLDKDFTYFRPGSEAAMNTVFMSSYEKGDPIVGYYWEPTWIMGKYDFVLLEDAPYNEKDFKEGKTACPSVWVTIAVSNKFAQKDPDFCAFLAKYHTSSKLTSEALSYMQDTGANHKETAKWFLASHPEFVDGWLDSDKAALVKNALK